MFVRHVGGVGARRGTMRSALTYTDRNSSSLPFALALVYCTESVVTSWRCSCPRVVQLCNFAHRCLLGRFLYFAFSLNPSASCPQPDPSKAHLSQSGLSRWLGLAVSKRQVCYSLGQIDASHRLGNHVRAGVQSLQER